MIQKGPCHWKRASCYNSPETRHTWANTKGVQAGRRGKHGLEPWLCFLWERQGREGGNGLKLASFHNIGALCSLGVVSSCLVPGLRQYGRRILGFVWDLDKGSSWGMDSRFTGKFIIWFLHTCESCVIGEMSQPRPWVQHSD